jgi:hypothetical protein
MYVNMSIVDAAQPEPYTDTLSPKRFGAVSPLDPQLFARVDDYAGELLAGSVSGKYSPVEVAQWLEGLAQSAAASLALVPPLTPDRGAPAFRRFALDVEVQIGLGRFFGQKLRAAVLFALFEHTGERAFLEAAVKAYRTARQAWARIAEVTARVYARDITYGDGWFQRGHWSDRLAAIDDDIAAMEQAALSAPPAAGSVITPEKISALVREMLGRSQRPVQPLIHVPPASLRRGQPVALEFRPAGGQAPIKAARILYRHTHQAQSWQAAPMQIQADGYLGAIPGSYTDTPYPLQYYFELSDEAGRAWLFPSLGANLSEPPYFVLR